MATCPKTTKVGEWGIPEKNYQNPVQWSLQEAHIILHNGNISKKLFQLILPLIFSLTKGKKWNAISSGPPSIPKSVQTSQGATERESNWVLTVMCTLGISVSLYSACSFSRFVTAQVSGVHNPVSTSN